MGAEANPANPAGAVIVTPPAEVKPPATPPADPPAAPTTNTPPAEPAKPEQPATPAPFNAILAEGDPAQPAKKEGDESGAEGGEGDPPAPAADFEPKFPEGIVADEAAVGFLKDKVKAGSLTGDQAQEMVDAHVAAIRRADESRIENGRKIIEGWHKEIESHPDFGGARFKESVENGKLMLHKYGSPRLIKEFAEMGVLDHPEFMFMLNRFHAELSEGASLGGSSEAGGERDPAKTMFPGFE